MADDVAFIYHFVATYRIFDRKMIREIIDNDVKLKGFMD